MRKLPLFLAAGAIVGVAVAYACDKGTTTAAAKPACSATGGVVAAANTADPGQPVPAVLNEGAPAAKSGGCPHAAEAKAGCCAGAVKAGNTEAKAGCCAGAAVKAGAAGGCPHAGKTAAASLADPKGGKEWRATGKVLCERCELGKAESCKSVFQQAGQAGYQPLCTTAVADQLLKLTKHGEMEVTVHGRLVNDDGGREILCVDGFSVGTI